MKCKKTRSIGKTLGVVPLGKTCYIESISKNSHIAGASNTIDNIISSKISIAIQFTNTVEFV